MAWYEMAKNEFLYFLLQENIGTLEVLADHSQCHYNLSCHRLRGLLRPLITNWHKDTNAASSHHVDHYLQSQINPNHANVEDVKISEAYEVGGFCRFGPTSSVEIVRNFVLNVDLFICRSV